MAPLNLHHRRTHNLLLVSKLLSLRENVSPFTLLLDSLEQSSKPLVTEYIRRATLSKVNVIFISYETIRPPKAVDHFIKARKLTPAALARDLTTYIATTTSTTQTPSIPKRFIIIIDSIHHLIDHPDPNFNIAAYLSSFLMPPRSQSASASTPPPQIALLTTYHIDIPSPDTQSAYAPSPLSLLQYLATTILTLHALPQVLARKAAHERSLAAPIFGLDEGRDGVVIGLPDAKFGSKGAGGIVLEMEYRRKSGRGVLEWYFLPKGVTGLHKQSLAAQAKETVMLLDDHPAFKKDEGGSGDRTGEDGEIESTFELGLTDRQRRDREGVVLPYFDAQKGAGPGEGGRILYDMGEEDDFDDEEDEI